MSEDTTGEDGWRTDDHVFFKLLRTNPPPRRVLWRTLKVELTNWKPLTMVVVGVLAFGIAVTQESVWLAVPGLWLLIAYFWMLSKATRDRRVGRLCFGLVHEPGTPHPYMPGISLTWASVESRPNVPVAVRAEALPSLISRYGTVEVAFLDVPKSPAPYSLTYAYRPV